ncbi:MAG: glycosyltransferase family 2 protein, partial [Bryobacteraceae bacterium]
MPLPGAVEEGTPGRPPTESVLNELRADTVGSHAERRDAWDWLLRVAILCGLPVLFYFTIHDGLFHPLLVDAETHHWMRLILRPTILWAMMGIILLTFRTIFWLRYKPFASATFADAPYLTVIIPAYNEGEMVLKSIESAATARYPEDRLEIFAVDDGSTDDTWKYIRQGAAKFPRLVQPIRLPKNGGKRAALAEGFRRARGSVVVTVDSDSVVEPNALLAIAGPFRDPKVGAVAGRVMVYNRREGLIPRMLHVRFILSFDFVRAVESSYGNVFCCPGALTGFRASAVMQ